MKNLCDCAWPENVLKDPCQHAKFCEQKHIFCPYSRYQTGGIDSSKAPLKGVIFHIVDISLQML